MFENGSFLRRRKRFKKKDAMREKEEMIKRQMSAAAAAAAASDLYHYSTQPHHHHHQPPPPPINCHQMLNNDPLDTINSTGKKMAKEEITKLKTEPIDASMTNMAPSGGGSGLPPPAAQTPFQVSIYTILSFQKS